MVYSGTISDKAGLPVKGAQVTFKNAAGGVIAVLSADNTGLWNVDTEFDSVIVAGGSVSFSAPGFTTYGISVSGLSPDFDVQLDKTKNTVLPWMIAAVMAAILFLPKGKRKVGKFGPSEVQTIFLIIGGLMSIALINKVLQMLHLSDDPKDKALNDESTNPESIWNPHYWKTYYPNASETDSLSADYAGQLADKIRSDLGVFYDDEDGVTAAIHELSTRADVSFLADIFAQRWGSDLLTYLRNGRGSLPENGLSASDVAALNSYVYSLPNS